MQAAVRLSPPAFGRARRFSVNIFALCLCLTATWGAQAQRQVQGQKPDQAPATSAKAASKSKPAPESQPPAAAQKPAPTSTTVVVRGAVHGNYLPEQITVGMLSSVPLKNAPLSATVVTRDLLDDQVARLLSDVVKNDASVEDDYVPVGYYGDYQIRGYPIDLATGLEIDGMTIAGS